MKQKQINAQIEVFTELEIPFSKESQQQQQQVSNNVKPKQERKKRQQKKMRNQEDQQIHSAIEQEEEYYIDPKCGNQLIQHNIDIIRHQQHILDNIYHLESFNQKLLSIWRQQINLLDSHDRFQLYITLGKLKASMRKLQLLDPITISKFLVTSNDKIIQLIESIINQIVLDFKGFQFEEIKDIKLYQELGQILGVLEKPENQLSQYQENFLILKKSVQLLLLMKNEDAKEEYLEFIQQILQFIVGICKLDNQIWKCSICELNNRDFSTLIDHIRSVHLKFLILLQGQRDKCFSLSCQYRKGNCNRSTYNLFEHLKEQHSEIYNQDKIFVKFLSRNEQLKASYYCQDKKHWKTNFRKDVVKVLEGLCIGKGKELERSEIFNKRGDGMFLHLKEWFYQQGQDGEQGILNCKVKCGCGQFDQLCYLLKLIWSNDVTKDIPQLAFVNDKFRNAPLRASMIQSIGELLDTKSSVLHQLHRYLFLGVFNFKLTLGELQQRVLYLEKLILSLGIFQAQLFNSNSKLKHCVFDEVLCKNVQFENLLKMYEHYFEAHTGVFYCLNSSFLKQNNLWNENFLSHKLSQIMLYSHDNHESDFKSRSKRYLRSCRKYFQVKAICCDCKRELNHYGEIYWRSNKLEKRKQIKLEFKYQITIKDVMSIYDSGVNEIENEEIQLIYLQQKEKDQLHKQMEKFKKELFEEMSKEILIDDQGRLSQCKTCNKQNKPNNPLLKDLKEEYFKLPFNEQNNFFQVKKRKLGDGEKIDEIPNSLHNEINTEELEKTIPKYLKVQQNILKRLEREKQGKLITDGGYFRIDSFPKLVCVYGNISESSSQNPMKVISQPILTGQMKVLFSTPLFYLPNTSILYEMQPNWKQTRKRFKLYGSSELQRREMIEMLESHPIISNHTYQMSRLTNLLQTQVDLMFKLNHHLIKQNKQFGNTLKFDEEKVNHELKKSADLMYFEGVLHRSQIIFLVQQFRIWEEVFSNVILQLQETIQEHLQLGIYKIAILEKFKYELEQFQDENSDYFNFSLMLLMGIFYCSQTSSDNYPFTLEKQIDENSTLFDFFVSDFQINPFRFIVEGNLQPILSPIIGQYVHPLFIGVLLQIFQLKLDQNVQKQEGYGQVTFYLFMVYEKLAKLSIKRCIPLFEKSMTQNKQKEVEKREEQEEEKDRTEKWQREQRWFQLELDKRLNLEEKVDMQCRYILAKRSLIKTMNSQYNEPLIQCDLRWTMQVGQLFLDYLQKKVIQSDDEMENKKEAEDHLEQLKSLHEEINHFFQNNKCTIPEDFLFQQYSINVKGKKGEKKEREVITSDLRCILEKIVQEDQKTNVHQYFDKNPYFQINKLKVAYFIPMEKKLQDLVKCVSKLRALPHKQAYRSYEKFHRYNFRELELLAFPELFPLGKGFQQLKAPAIERSVIVIEINKNDQEQASEILQNLGKFKKHLNKQEVNDKQMKQKIDNKQINKEKKNKITMNVEFQDFTTQLREGLDYIPKAKNAIFQLKREDYIRKELSSSFVYDMQNISMIKIFQEAQESAECKEKYFELDKEIEIKIEGEVLSESITQKHVQENLGKMLKKQVTWSNEIKQFIKELSEEVVQRKNNQQRQNLSDDLQEYIRMKEKIFLEQKQQELMKQFSNIDLSGLEVLRNNECDLFPKSKIQRIDKSIQQKNSKVGLEEEIHSEILIQVSTSEEQAEQAAIQVQKEISTFQNSFTTIAEDTRYRITNKATRVFNTRFSFIFWRFTQRLLSRFFGYFAAVNGINVNKSGVKTTENKAENTQIKDLQKLPPLKGTDTYFKQKYKEQRAICFQRGSPIFFLTYTLHEFNYKNQKIVQGLNFFDLEDQEKLKERRTKLSKKQYNLLTKQFTIYFYYLCKQMTRCLTCTKAEIKKDFKTVQLYDNGIFGKCVGFTNRFEFQQRGTVHLHQLLYMEEGENGEVKEEYLEYWAALLSMWNFHKQGRGCQDRKFIEDYKLIHDCTRDCIKVEGGNCRKGYPNEIRSTIGWQQKYPSKIFPRVQSDEEARIFPHDRDIVKFFGSSCIVELTGSQRIIDYMTKYMHKSQKSTDDVEEEAQEEKQEGGGEEKKQGQEKQSKVIPLNAVQIEKDEQIEEEQGQQKKTIKQQMNDLLHKYMTKKITSLSEAYSDLLDFPLFQTSFQTIRIPQLQLSQQYKFSQSVIKSIFVDEESGKNNNPLQDIRTSLKQSTWIKYLARPKELELLNLYEFVQNFIWYGNKQKHKRKSENLKEGIESQYLVDLNGQLVKMREKPYEVILNLSSVYYVEDVKYEQNLFYLAMLQLYWPHRQDTWYLETNDTCEGFKIAYHKFYNEKHSEKQEYKFDDELNLKWLGKCRRFNSFKNSVDNYKQLSTKQKSFLENIQFAPNQKKNKQHKEKEAQYRTFVSYHSLLRARSSIQKLTGLLQQEVQTFPLTFEIGNILKYLQMDVLINIEQREQIQQTEIAVIQYLNRFRNIIEVPSTHLSLLEELSSLLIQSNFCSLQNSLSEKQKPNQSSSSPIKRVNSSTFPSSGKVSQMQIESFFNFNDENLKFPQQFRTQLSIAEFHRTLRPQFNEHFLNEGNTLSQHLQEIYEHQCNRQQKLSILVLLQHLYQSQVLGEDDVSSIYEGCLIHGGGGVGKSFIIQFLIQFMQEIGMSYYILCPTQVAVLNILGEEDKDSRVCTIHSFLYLKPHININTYYNHFLEFLRVMNKEKFFKTTTSLLYPELAYYNCNNNVERFTEKLKGVRCIILEEISMMDPKFFTLLDVYLQVSLCNSKTFGGIQIFAFGDSFQLQPVIFPPAFYFESHVFKNGYFSTYLELNQPVRQASDVQYYTEILQPLRMGTFNQHKNYRNSLRLLRQRHIDENVNSPQMALGLKDKIQRLQVENAIIFLYLENEAVTKENQRRADQHINQIMINQAAQKKFKSYINLPAKISFDLSNNIERLDKLLMNLSSDYDVINELADKNITLNYQTHFKLIPLSIRSYIGRVLMPHVYEKSRNCYDKTASNFRSCPQQIKLFRNAQIVFRRNVEKSTDMINGQTAIIKDILFDIDFQSNENLEKQQKEKEEIIQKYLSTNLLRDLSYDGTYFHLNFNKEFLETAQEELEKHDFNNTNCLIDEEILNSEKLDFVKCGIQPRLQALSIQVQGSENPILVQNLQNYYQHQNVQMPTDKVKGILKQCLHDIQLLQNKLIVCKDSGEQNKVAEKIFYENQSLFFMLGLEILKNSIDSHFFKKAVYHLEQFLNQLPLESVPIKLQQLPFNLAYARTIHTSQGATFNNVCVTLNSNHVQKAGLLYTALSRVKNLQSLFLQGDFDEEIFNLNVPDEIIQFYKNNFVEVSELLCSKYFQMLLENQGTNLPTFLRELPKLNNELRKKLLKQLPRRSISL